MTPWIPESSLVGEHIRLDPMSSSDGPALVAAASDGELWRLWFTLVPSAETIDSYVQTAIANREMRGECPYVVRDISTDKIIGTTRFCNVDASNRRLEIGYTWYSKSFQRSLVNTEAKLLLLRLAFEDLNCIAVEFRTHWHNRASRRAIERLGAKQDGVLRNHRKCASGGYRDTVVFSIIECEWPTVRQKLNSLLSRV